MKRTLLIDFDGVIHRYSHGWHDGTAYDGPMEGARQSLETLTARGYEVVIFSTRPAEQVVKWLQEYDFPDYEVTDVKRKAHAIIDDRAIRFTNWQDIRNYF